MTKKRVSIIVPIYKVNEYFVETVSNILLQTYPDFELLLGVDKNVEVPVVSNKLVTISTGRKNTGPAEKRDLAISRSTGEIIGFIDDDSYPAKNWISTAVEKLEREKVDVVCGPGLTPPADSYQQKITGGILSSKYGTGPYRYRFTKESKRFVDDYPAYNMFAKKVVLDEVGGYGTKFYGGEDTALCIKIINAGYKILYHPEIVVYHHRRKFPREYVSQVGNVGKHRGYFVKKYPKTSLRPSYFAPAIFTLLFPLLFLVSLVYVELLVLLLSAFFLFFGIVLITESKKNKLTVNVMLPFAIPVNYFAYGVRFLQGLLFTRKLVR